MCRNPHTTTPIVTPIVMTAQMMIWAGCAAASMVDGVLTNREHRTLTGISDASAP